MKILDIAYFFTGFFESVITFMLFDNYMEKRKNFTWYIYLICIILMTITINLSNGLFSTNISNLLCITVIMILFSFLYISDIKIKIILPLISVLMSTCSEILVLYVISNINKISNEELLANQNLCLLGIVLSKSLNFAVIKIICVHKKQKIMNIQTGYWIMFATVFAVSVITVYSIFNPPLKDELNYISIFSALGLMYSVFITLYLYEHMAEQTQQLKEKELMERQLNMQINHLDELILAQKRMRNIQHDLSNHMISVRAYLKEKDYVNCNKYVEKLINKVNVQTDFIDTGNTIIDAVLSAKRNLAKEKNIEFLQDIQIPEKILLNSADGCIILGNSLDNAIEACEKVDGKKYIKINMKYHDKKLSCKITNSMPDEENEELSTTKEDVENHGIGLTNLKDTLNKYNNICKIEQNNGEFTLMFIIFE